MQRALRSIISALVLISPGTAFAFCGFYVAGGDAKMFNETSQVVIARSGDRTVITMANDYKGDPTEFAMVVPVPTVLEAGQIHVGDLDWINRLDQYSAPRLVEYFDPSPCRGGRHRGGGPQVRGGRSGDAKFTFQGIEIHEHQEVTVEAAYTIGEYDIVLLSADDSRSLRKWLKKNGYKTPRQATKVLDSYVRNGMKFFVARVNLDKQQSLGYEYLRPIQIAYVSPRFMLPIRLGMVNSRGTQDMVVYTLTNKGRVETTNYRTVPIPTDKPLPTYVKDDFGSVYQAIFANQVEEHGRKAVMTEFAWDAGWCDPCPSVPMTASDLRNLGVFWLPAKYANARRVPKGIVFVTRLHVRYDAEHFPEDLVLQETADRQHFQGRYVMRHFWTGDTECDAAAAYRAQLAQQREAAGRSLAGLTGWDVKAIRNEMAVALDWSKPSDGPRWWETIWKD